MISRRSLFGAIGVLPAIAALGAAVKADVISGMRKVGSNEMALVNAANLRSWRDQLLPVVREFATAEVDLDVLIDLRSDAIIVRGIHSRTRRDLAFCVSRSQLDDGINIVWVRQRCESLVYQLSLPLYVTDPCHSHTINDSGCGHGYGPGGLSTGWIF